MQPAERHLFYPHSVQTERARSPLARVRNDGGFLPGPWPQFAKILIEITTPGALEMYALAQYVIRNGKAGSEFTRRGAVWGTILPLR